MKRKAECLTLREYREQVLKLPQAEVARLTGCKQAWISRVERGHLPRPWNRAQLCRAYRLTPAEFERLVTASARVLALQIPLVESAPLLAEQQTSERARVEQLSQLMHRAEQSLTQSKQA